MIVIVDIDGTLSNPAERLHLIENKPAKWEEFFNRCGEDSPISSTVKMIGSFLEDSESKVILLTGRPESVRLETSKWLSSVFEGYPYENCMGLIMKTKEDIYTQARVFKEKKLEEILEEHLEHADEEVIAFEDDDLVVDMFLSKGITVYHVKR